MRSRYTAYVVGAIDYIFETCHENIKSRLEYEGTKKWSEKAKWQGLKIIAVSGGEETAGKGTVHFEAYYEQDFMSHIYHEIAKFEKYDDRWLYVGGEVIPKTETRNSEKIGRNDHCPKKKKKKYKHCCGR
jgi:SEC-C motif-containing protein